MDAFTIKYLLHKATPSLCLVLFNNVLSMSDQSSAKLTNGNFLYFQSIAELQEKLAKQEEQVEQSEQAEKPKGNNHDEPDFE